MLLFVRGCAAVYVLHELCGDPAERMDDYVRATADMYVMR